MCQLCHPLLKASADATGDAVVLFNSSVAGGPLALMSGTIYGLTKVGRWAGGGLSRRAHAACWPSARSMLACPVCWRMLGSHMLVQAALNQLAKNLTCEWAGQHIRAIAVAPW